jgi:transposase-like protein
VVLVYESNQNITLTAKKMHVDAKTVRKWVKRYQQDKVVTDKKRAQRTSCVPDAAAQRAVQLLLGNSHSGLHEVAQELHREGYTSKLVHRVTLGRVAKAYAKREGMPIKAVRRAPVKLLNHATKAKRVAFCKAHKAFNWGQVMFTDRKRFLFRYPGTRVNKVQWVREGQPREALMVNHPSGVNLYAGLTRFGMTKVHLVAGTTNHTTSFKNKKGQKAKNITTQEYEEVVLKNLLPEGKRIFSHQGISTWTLQQDNDPTHKKGSLAALNKWHQAGNPGVELLSGWPANSPDLSPIENIWAWAQQKVDKMGCKTFPEFQQAVLDTLNSVPASMLRKLFASMPRRTGDCMALEGAKTSY